MSSTPLGFSRSRAHRVTGPIWILGATGRTGRDVARRLHATGNQLVLAGRDGERVSALSASLGGQPTAAGPLAAQLEQLRESRPSVVVNTIGPFTDTALPVLAACPPGTHYVDVSNELAAVTAVLDLHGAAISRGSTYVTGAGFGVLGTESATLRLCENRPTPSRVRVDAIPSVAMEEGVVGVALASSIIEGLPEGGRRVSGGKLARSRVATDGLRLTTPNGEVVTTGSLPSGELLAAWRVSGAPVVIAASSAVPAGRGTVVAVVVLSLITRFGPFRRWAIRQVAARPTRAGDRPREHSWGRAYGEWSDGSTGEVWLRVEDAMDFTTASVAAVSRRLADGGGRPGAYTPAALFGTGLATGLGCTFIEQRTDASTR